MVGEGRAAGEQLGVVAVGEVEERKEEEEDGEVDGVHL